jgi:hypothetical protein
VSKTKMMFTFGILLAVTACQNPYNPECISRSVGSEEMVQLDEMLMLFEDSEIEVEQISHTSLETVIQELREISSAAEDIEVERCLIPYQQDILSYMDYTIDAYVALSIGESEEVVLEAFEASELAYQEYLQERNWLANAVGD